MQVVQIHLSYNVQKLIQRKLSSRIFNVFIFSWALLVRYLPVNLLVCKFAVVYFFFPGWGGGGGGSGGRWGGGREREREADRDRAPNIKHTQTERPSIKWVNIKGRVIKAFFY